MNVLRQILAVTALNLRNIPARLGTSLVVIVGIAGVVAVLVSVLAMSNGMISTMRSSGRADRAIVMRGGAVSEMASELARSSSGNQIDAITDAPGVRHDAKGKPIASPEMIAVALVSKADGSEASVPVRGIGPAAFLLRPEMKIVEGRMFQTGLREVVVGRNARKQYPELVIDGSLALGEGQWRIVGVFESGGDTHESELMTDVATLQTALDRAGSVQSVTVMLESTAALSTFRDALTSDPRLSVEVTAEPQYFSEQTKTVSGVLSMVAYVVGGIMAVGALFAALNTMYSAISARALEIGTLRAIGFRSGPVVFSVLVESLVLALLGGVVGAVVGWLLFNGHTMSTAAGSAAGESRVFSMDVSFALATSGVLLACFIGLIGGIFPAIRAARIPVVEALRAT